MVTMMISLMWGVCTMILGVIFRFSLGQLLSGYVSGIETKVDLLGTVNSAGQNICPVETDISNEIYLGSWAVYLGSLIMISGFLIILYSAMGVVAGLKHNGILLMAVIVVILLSCAMEYWLLQITTNENFGFHNDAKEELVDLIISQYKIEGSDIFTTAFNAVMLTGRCCGIVSVMDFGNMTFVDKSNNMELSYFMVPPACCKRPVFNDNPSMAFNALKKCAIEGWKSDSETSIINTVGCYTVVYSYVNTNFGTVILLVLVSLAVWEIVQLVLAMLLIFTAAPLPPKPPTPRKPTLELLAKEEAATEERVKPVLFVPFAKISSFQHPDIHRIKSTEIW